MFTRNDAFYAVKKNGKLTDEEYKSVAMDASAWRYLEMKPSERAEYKKRYEAELQGAVDREKAEEKRERAKRETELRDYGATCKTCGKPYSRKDCNTVDECGSCNHDRMMEATTCKVCGEKIYRTHNPNGKCSGCTYDEMTKNK